ncbi:hypothetical protein RJ55_02749 [Drechmeria coniospora]|nr:hypothetical protein RJ55_02749 [Drechmeria coniospora]
MLTLSQIPPPARLLKVEKGSCQGTQGMFGVRLTSSVQFIFNELPHEIEGAKSGVENVKESMEADRAEAELRILVYSHGKGANNAAYHLAMAQTYREPFVMGWRDCLGRGSELPKSLNHITHHTSFITNTGSSVLSPEEMHMRAEWSWPPLPSAQMQRPNTTKAKAQHRKSKGPTPHMPLQNTSNNIQWGLWYAEAASLCKYEFVARDVTVVPGQRPGRCEPNG